MYCYAVIRILIATQLLTLVYSFEFIDETDYSIIYYELTSNGSIITGESDIHNTSERKLQTCEVQDHPYMVSVQRIMRTPQGYEHWHICSATIIAQRVIISAAHCYYKEPINGLIAKAGVADLAVKSEFEQSSMISRVYYHPEYKNRLDIIDNDICILTVHSRFRFNTYVNKITLAFNKPRTGMKCISVGWQSSKPHTEALRLEFQTILDVKPTKCRQYRSYTDTGMLCVSQHHQNSTCQSYPGGPIICDNKQYGLFSVGPSVCALSYLNIYTQIQNQEQFIRNYYKDSHLYVYSKAAKLISIQIIMTMNTIIMTFISLY